MSSSTTSWSNQKKKKISLAANDDVCSARPMAHDQPPLR